MRRLPARHRAWVVAKGAVAGWLIVYAIFTPPATNAVLGAFVWVWVSVAVGGLAASIVGMLLAVQGRRSGRVVELTALVVAAAGPLIHAITLAAITIGAVNAGAPDVTARFGPIMQSVAIAAFLAVRYVEVFTRNEVIR